MNVLRKNIISLFVLQGANYILPLVTIPYLVRVLGPANFGRIAFAQAFIQYFVMLTDYGFNLSATRDIARAEGDKAAISTIFNAVLGVKLLTMLAGFIVMTGIAQLVPTMRADYPLFALSYLAVVGNALFPVWLYQGTQRMGYITAFTMVARTLVVLTIFITVRQQDQYLRAAGLLALGMPLAGVVALVWAARVTGVRFAWPRWSAMKKAVVDGWHVFTGVMSVTLFSNSNVFVLGLMTNPEIVGYFAAAEKLVRAVTGLTAPVAQATYPHISRLIKNSTENAWKFIKRMGYIQGVATMISSLVLLLMSDQLVNAVYGLKMLDAAGIVKIISFLPFIIGLNNLMGTQIMLNIGMSREFSTALMLTGVFNIIIVGPLILFMGANGAAVALISSEILECIIMSYRLTKRKTLFMKPAVQYNN